MTDSSAALGAESLFMRKNVPLLLDRFDISCALEGACAEYFIEDKASHQQLSKAIIFSLNRFSHKIHVNRFYPELFRQENSRYLSAACFYLLIHHFAHALHVEKSYSIFLQTQPRICEEFYARLRDFDFHVVNFDLGDVVNVTSTYMPLPVDTSMIHENTAMADELLFMV